MVNEYCLINILLAYALLAIIICPVAREEVRFSFDIHESAYYCVESPQRNCPEESSTFKGHYNSGLKHSLYN